jgi:hypothetical protein
MRTRPADRHRLDRRRGWEPRTAPPGGAECLPAHRGRAYPGGALERLDQVLQAAAAIRC